MKLMRKMENVMRDRNKRRKTKRNKFDIKHVFKRMYHYPSYPTKKMH